MKRILAIGLVLVFSFGFTLTAFASPVWCIHDNCFYWDGRWSEQGHHFWDSDGNFLSRADVEANLDAAVTAGTITAEDRDFLLERYDFCAAYGGGALGRRCGGAGRGGFGRGAGWGGGQCHHRW